MKSPLLILASCFALGILLARCLPAGPVPAILLLASAGVCLLAGLGMVQARRFGVAALLALAGFVFAGAAAAGIFQHRFPADHIRNLADWGFNLQNDVELEGVIVTAPVRARYGFVFELMCRKVGSGSAWRPAQGKVQLRMFTPSDPRSWAAADALHLHYGDMIRAPVRLEKATVYGNPGGFDFRWWMETVQDISWEGEIKNPLVVQKLAEAQASWFAMTIVNVRSRLLNGIDRLYPPWTAEGRVGAVLKAVLLGDRSSLDTDTVENFRQSGLYHLLVIAGLHVGILAAVILFFLQFFRLGEFSRAAFLLAFLIAYALLVEQRAPTLRATLMITAYFLARLLYRRRVALNAVGLAALVLLVYRPAWLFEAGFDLSFSAVLLIAGLALPILEHTTLPYRKALGRLDETRRDPAFAPRQAQFRLSLRALIAGAKGRIPFLDRRPGLAERAVTVPFRVVLWTVELVLFSAVIQIGLFMPMAETFHRITLVGIGLNTLALPLMTVLIAVAVPTMILGATLPAVAVWPGKLLLWITQSVLAVTEIEHIPRWLSYRLPGPPFWVALGFALALIAAAWTIRRNMRAFRVSLGMFAVFALVMILYPFAPRIPKGRLEVTALDCGRGQALFTVLPDGTTLLMDAGGRERFGPVTGRWNPGEEIVSPYLWSLGLRKIDILVLANTSEENIRAMDAVIHNFKVGELWHGPRVFSPAYEDLARAARERGVAIRQIAAGDQAQSGRADVQVLWPPLTPQGLELSAREDFPVLRIAQGDGSALLQGRTDDRIEEALARSAGPIASDVLELAHGSAARSLDPEFVAQVNPRVLLITGEGRDGAAGDPPAAFKALRASGVRVFQTAVDGAVTVEIDGARLAVHCYRRPARPTSVP